MSLESVGEIASTAPRPDVVAEKRDMDQRVLATSAVRCVGSTLLIHGRVYPPPYRISVVGPAERMQRALDASPRVDLYRQYVQLLGLGLTVEEESDIMVPAYEGPLRVAYAQVVE